MDEGLPPPAYPGAWVGYTEHVSEEVHAAMLQEVFEHFDQLTALEAGATARTSTPVESQPEEIPTFQEETAGIAMCEC